MFHIQYYCLHAWNTLKHAYIQFGVGYVLYDIHKSRQAPAEGHVKCMTRMLSHSFGWGNCLDFDMPACEHSGAAGVCLALQLVQNARSVSSYKKNHIFSMAETMDGSKRPQPFACWSISKGSVIAFQTIDVLQSTRSVSLCIDKQEYY